MIQILTDTLQDIILFGGGGFALGALLIWIFT